MAIHLKFSSTVDIELDTDCELLWAKVKVRGYKDLCIGTYYRPPGNKESLAQLEISLLRMWSTFNGHIIIAGDFNLSAIDWETHEVLSGAPNTREASKLLQDIKIHKAPGPEKIVPRLLHDFAHILAEPLVEIFNKSLETSDVPHD